MYRWGMVIDLDKCTACQACVVACRQENNIPIMGEAYAKLGRAKFWINLLSEVKGTYPDTEMHFFPLPACTVTPLPAQRSVPLMRLISARKGS